MIFRPIATPTRQHCLLLEMAASWSVDGCSVPDMLAGSTVYELRTDAGEMVGCMVLEARRSGELHCNALAALPGADAVRHAVGWARLLAWLTGCNGLSCDTRRPAMARLLRRYGFTNGRGWTLAAGV